MLHLTGRGGHGQGRPLDAESAAALGRQVQVPAPPNYQGGGAIQVRAPGA
jgi:hypothetical protein